MSESLINASVALAPTEYFSANVQVHGAQVHINATTLDAMLKTLAQFGYKGASPTALPSVNQAHLGKTAGEIAAETTNKAQAKTKDAAAQVEKSDGPTTAEPSTSSTTAASQPSPSSNGDEAPRPTYDDVKKAVLALAKISPETAKATLAKFTGQNGQPCDHGTKLKLEDYPAFLAAADEQLKVAA